jgi:glycosyltransferase involved in cell wall biosynthesis
VLDAFAPQVGGVETEFVEFTRGLVTRGWEVVVLTATSSGAVGSACRDGVEVHYLPWRTTFGHPVPRQRDLDRWIAWCDVVHTTTYSTATAARRASRRHARPCVLSVQECLGRRWFWVEPPWRAAAFYAYERYVVTRPFAAYHAISHATRRDLVAAGVSDRLIDTIHLGVDPGIWNPAVPARDLNGLLGFPPESRVFLFTGRPGRTKGADVLLDAIALVGDSLADDVRFGFILGDHPPRERERFRARVEKRGLKTVVSIVPSVPYEELPGYVRAAYCIVVPSITEGFGLCAAEAAASGARLLTSDAGSLPEVASGRHLVFRNRDARDLALRLREASDDRFVETAYVPFSWDAAVDALVDLYARVLSPTRRAVDAG